MIENDVPAPPLRLFADRRMLNQIAPSAWENRRASKMRERFPIPNHQPVQGLSLIAPVQPSIRSYTPAGRML